MDKRTFLKFSALLITSTCTGEILAKEKARIDTENVIVPIGSTPSVLQYARDRQLILKIMRDLTGIYVNVMDDANGKVFYQEKNWEVVERTANLYMSNMVNKRIVSQYKVTCDLSNNTPHMLELTNFKPGMDVVFMTSFTPYAEVIRLRIGPEIWINQHQS